jgi:hypothetical protein
MGIFASPNRALIMSSVPANRRGIAAGTSTTLVLTGSTFSLGLSFLIMTHIMPLGDVENILLGSFGSENHINSGNNNNNNSNSSLVASMEMDRFVDSIHIIFLVSAILMLIAIVPSVLREEKKQPRSGISG